MAIMSSALAQLEFHRVTAAASRGSRMTPCQPRSESRKRPSVGAGHGLHTAQEKTARTYPLARPIKREPGPVRVVGISATAQDPQPRFSTSEALLEVALAHARGN